MKTCASRRRRGATGSRSRAHARSKKSDAISIACGASTRTWCSASRTPRASTARDRACCASQRGSSRRSRTRSTALPPTRSSTRGLTCATRFAPRRRTLAACTTCGSIPRPCGAPLIRCRSTRARRRCGSGWTRPGAAIITRVPAPRRASSSPNTPRSRRRSTPGSPATWTSTCGASSLGSTLGAESAATSSGSFVYVLDRVTADAATLELTVLERDSFRSIDASVNWLNDNITVTERLDVADFVHDAAATARSMRCRPMPPTPRPRPAATFSATPPAHASVS